jgi:hypothetical protein
MGMGAVAASGDDEQATKMEAGADTVGQKLDAGALFVLQSKGNFITSLSTVFLLPPIPPTSIILSLFCCTLHNICMPTVCALLTNLTQPSLCFSSTSNSS